MIRVLFVCLGNICRSPMAEAVMRDIVKSEGLEKEIMVDSAGTGNWHIGNPPHEGTRSILEKQEIEYEGMKARQVIQDDLFDFDYIIAMDGENLGNLHRLAGYNKTGVIKRLLDYVPEAGQDDVPDPYFTGNFEEVYEMVKSGCENLLNTIKETHQL
ncbi:low molecular weight protein-tyrosine-phosphatase [Bacillus carboniphilus]|uniref:protein-tyrosine-phosphatase n=1 Tax=Bacillus carboniphilus TaxID=86663 RepID=A0ABY9JY05_9BACI|nr:low molecular weight protein-tyrosine-phosphatase [Bacillus carboniphilus]WLR42500.1 low molecular weight protein-tyrosine-phosphatase [Bacillus carboniphilus]